MPAVSTLQLAFARFKTAWQDIKIATCHTADAGEWLVGAPVARPVQAGCAASPGVPAWRCSTGRRTPRPAWPGLLTWPASEEPGCRWPAACCCRMKPSTATSAWPMGGREFSAAQCRAVERMRQRRPRLRAGGWRVHPALAREGLITKQERAPCRCRQAAPEAGCAGLGHRRRFRLGRLKRPAWHRMGPRLGHREECRRRRKRAPTPPVSGRQLHAGRWARRRSTSTAGRTRTPPYSSAARAANWTP